MTAITAGLSGLLLPEGPAYFLCMRQVAVSKISASGFPEGLLRLSYESDCDGFLDEALLLPPSAGEWWVVCLHGFAGHSNQIFVRKDIKQNWLPAFIEGGYGVFSPNLRGDAWMNEAAQFDLQQLLGHLRQHFGARHFIFTSGSMGAAGSLIYAFRHPEDVDGLDLHGTVCDMAAYYESCSESKLPLVNEVRQSLARAYGATPKENPDIYASQSAIRHANVLHGIPFFLMHGSLDEIMPVAQSRRLAAALADSSRFAYMEVPGGDHNAPLSLERNLLPGMTSPLDWIRSFHK